MHVRSSFDYAIIRVVPRVERGECINVGIILICRTRRFLGALIELDAQRLLALAPDCDMALIEEHLATIPRICKGGAEAGYIGQLSQSERFHWLVAPRSTIIQTAPTHSGLCTDPAATLEHLMETMVRLSPPSSHEHSL
ncbi:MAG TPA: DUF3037 domain-containing protein [Ktedonobacteraceae bacterium]|nr:DUF3037 domain-containing protein [Ktedonobacteraceae bacterium]